MIPNGVYPTMITPYREGRIDYDNVKRLVDWYDENGCRGIFAVCQSSEMNFLSLEERVELARRVVEYADGRMTVVASGHCGVSLDEQVEEINRISDTGIDAFVLVSNRLDPHNEGDDAWIANAEKLLARIHPSIPLGIYECPLPYKRLLTPRILDFCISTGRFAFIKDTCCDPDLLTARLEQLKGSGIGLFNANAQTLLHSLEGGAAGYSGIMANFHPDLLVRLCDSFREEPERALRLSDFLSMAAFTESPAYPCTAKYYLGLEGFSMSTESRSSRPQNLTSYQKLIVRQLWRQSRVLREEF